MSMSNYAEDLVLDTLFNGGSDPYIQLHNADPGEAGTTGVVNHARVQAAFAAASGGTLSNSANIDFATMPAETVVAWSAWDAAGTGGPPSGGNCIWTGWLSTLSGLAIVRDEDLTGNTVECPTHGLANDDRVVFEVVEGLVVPTGITAGALYFVLAVTDDDFTISATQDGAAIDVTGEGQAIWRRVNPKVVQLNDTLRVPSGDLDVFLD